ncbi:hypothetical protein [Xanthomonas arboricola]|uniref:hypothetical protein n=1 Tax=Xanthomonas arboricola TaxID=56448 RepID=UPI0015E39B98|nr:hypothetical protein [Xanthomonas arboricola]
MNSDLHIQVRGALGTENCIRALSTRLPSGEKRPVGQHYGLAGTELVVGVTPDSNNSARKLFSALGSRITFAGAGCGFGEALGFTAGPTVPQLESTAAQVSHNSIRDGLGRLPVFFMLGSNVGQHLGLFVFGGPRGLLNL